MSDSRCEAILKTIKSAYLQQFEQNLDEQLLMEVVERELQKKREAFLQVQLATSGLSIAEMSALKSFLLAQDASLNPRPALTLKKQQGNGLLSRVAELDDEAAADDEDEGLDSSKREKRRAYARAYYHRKKSQRENSDARSSKKFKTTPEQRAYQRAYYQRKKAEKDHLDEEGPLAKVAAKALDAQKKALAKPERERPRGRKSKVDYDSLAADRLAIEHAFRPGLDDDDTATLTLHPKTKLRKAASKSGSLTN